MGNVINVDFSRKNKKEKTASCRPICTGCDCRREDDERVDFGRIMLSVLHYNLEHRETLTIRQLLLDNFNIALARDNLDEISLEKYKATCFGGYNHLLRGRALVEAVRKLINNNEMSCLQAKQLAQAIRSIYKLPFPYLGE